MNSGGFETARSWCRERLPLPAEDLALAALFSPRQQRPQVTALTAIFVELEAIATRPRDLTIARTKLGWWREELQRSETGRASHPAARWLAATEVEVPWGALGDLVTGFELSLLGGPVDNLEAAERRAEYGLARLALALAGLTSAGGIDAGLPELGRTLGLARILRLPGLQNDVAQAIAAAIPARLRIAPSTPPPLRVMTALAWRRVDRGGEKRDFIRVLLAWQAARGRLPRGMGQAVANENTGRGQLR